MPWRLQPGPWRVSKVEPPACMAMLCAGSAHMRAPRSLRGRGRIAFVCVLHSVALALSVLCVEQAPVSSIARSRQASRHVLRRSFRGLGAVTERVCEPPLRGGTRIHALTCPRAESRTAHTPTVKSHTHHPTPPARSARDFSASALQRASHGVLQPSGGSTTRDRFHRRPISDCMQLHRTI